MHLKITDLKQIVTIKEQKKVNCIYQFRFPKGYVTGHHCLTIVIKSVRDLMPNDHPYSSEVKGLVLVFTEERWLQDSCRKHWMDRNE